MAAKVRSAAAELLASLPFTNYDAPRGAKAKTHKQFWSVHPTGDYGQDCITGQRFALMYLAIYEACDFGGLLASIVSEMPRGDDQTGIEVGFLTMIDHVAKNGAPAARRLNAYWEECRRQAAAKAKATAAKRSQGKRR